MSLELNEILKIALKGGASDIHMKSGLPPIFRIDGALVPLKNAERLLPEYLEKMAAGIMNAVQKERFAANRECDLAYGIAGLGRFRVNVFQQRGTVGVVFRVIPFGVKTIDQLVLPKVVACAIAAVSLNVVFDVVAIVGGALFARGVAEIEFSAFGEQLRTALNMADFLVALAKSCTFGAFVGIVGCALGLRVKDGSEGVGRATTNSVVLGIFLIIVVDAIYVTFQRMVG